MKVEIPGTIEAQDVAAVLIETESGTIVSLHQADGETMVIVAGKDGPDECVWSELREEKE